MVIKLVETLLISVVSVCPVVIRLLVNVEMSPSLLVIWVWRVCPVVIKLPLKVSTLPLNAVTSVPPAIPETIAISEVKGVLPEADPHHGEVH